MTVSTQSNVVVSIPSFATGTTDPVVVTATKLDQTLGSQVGLRVTDVAGNVTACDPVLLSASRDTGQPTSQTITVAKQESVVHVHNGSPGLTNLHLSVMAHPTSWPGWTMMPSRRSTCRRPCVTASIPS